MSHHGAKVCDAARTSRSSFGPFSAGLARERVLFAHRRAVPQAISKDRHIFLRACGAEFSPITYTPSRWIVRPGVNAVAASQARVSPGGDRSELPYAPDPPSVRGMVVGVVPGVWQRVPRSDCHRAEVDLVRGIFPQGRHPMPIWRGAPASRHAVVVVPGVDIKGDDPLVKIGNALNAFCLSL